MKPGEIVDWAAQKESAPGMIRVNQLTPERRDELGQIVRRPCEDHGVARDWGLSTFSASHSHKANDVANVLANF